MTKPLRCVLLLACVISGTQLVLAAGERAVDKRADEAGVRDAENRWSEAFMEGDAATLDTLLDADYISTGTNGKARDKAQIIKLAQDFAKAHPGQHASPLAPTSSIRVIGNAAVVQHRNSADTSVDVFYFRDGRWHAWYSQHTRLEI